MLKSDRIRGVTTIGAGLVLAALLAVLVLLGARPAEAAFPGENGKIAFVGRVKVDPSTYNEEIFKMNPDGSKAMRLTHNTAQDHDPAWSPDSQKIAFVSDDDIYIMDADPLTNDAINITNTPEGEHVHYLSPTWSPDGQKIAFTRWDNRVQNYEIYVMDTDPSTNDEPVNITNSRRTLDYGPDWSPSGGKIAFERWGRDLEIFVMNKDGSRQKRLTDGTKPAWSPNGRKIAYTRPYVDGEFRDSDIWVMNNDGSGQKRLTDNRRDDSSPDWQPIVP